MLSDRLQEVMQMENQSCPKMLRTEFLNVFSAFYLQYPSLGLLYNVNPELSF